MFAINSQFEPLVRRADIFEVQDSEVPQGMPMPPEVSRQRFGVRDASTRLCHLKMNHTSFRGSVSNVSPLPASPKSLPVLKELTASESTSSRTTQDVVSVDANEVLVLVFWIEDCNFWP